MPKKRKQKLSDKTNNEVIEKLFPKKAVDHMKEVAHQEDKSGKPSQSPHPE